VAGPGRVMERTRASEPASSTCNDVPSVTSNRPASAPDETMAISRSPPMPTGSSTGMFTAALVPPAVVTVTELPLPAGCGAKNRVVRQKGIKVNLDVASDIGNGSAAKVDGQA